MSVAELTRHAVHVLPEGELERKLKLGRPLRVKLGIDPLVLGIQQFNVNGRSLFVQLEHIPVIGLTGF